MKCKHCGEIHPDDFMFCPTTGNKIYPDKIICNVCGNKNIPKNSKFCPYCGSELDCIISSGVSEMHVDEHNYEDIQHAYAPVGLFYVKNNGKWGIINSHLEEVYPCSLEDYDYETSEKFIAVSKSGDTFDDEDIIKYGYIDYQGNQIIPCIYDRAFISGVGESFVLKKDDKCGVINSKGVTLVPFKWDNNLFLSRIGSSTNGRQMRLH